MEKQFIRGESTEDKFASIEATLQHMSRRLGHKVVGVMPPVPMFWSKDKPESDGLLMRALVPLDGTIAKAWFLAGSMSTKKATLTATIVTDLASSSMKVEITKPLQSYELNWKIAAGTIFEVYISPVDSVENVQLALLMYPDINKLNTEKFLLDEVLKLEEGDK